MKTMCVSHAGHHLNIGKMSETIKSYCILVEKTCIICMLIISRFRGFKTQFLTIVCITSIHFFFTFGGGNKILEVKKGLIAYQC